MKGFIDNYNFKEMPAQKYWAPPASWSFEKKKETTQSRIFSGDWYAAEKKDGYFAKLVKDEDGNVGLYSRSRNVNGEYPENTSGYHIYSPFLIVCLMVPAYWVSFICLLNPALLISPPCLGV